MTIGCSTTTPSGTEMYGPPVRKASLSSVKASGLPSAQAPSAAGPLGQAGDVGDDQPLAA